MVNDQSNSSSTMTGSRSPLGPHRAKELKASSPYPKTESSQISLGTTNSFVPKPTSNKGEELFGPKIDVVEAFLGTQILIK